MIAAEFLERIEEILNVDPGSLSMESPLADHPTFDSVAVLSIIVLLDEEGRQVPGSAIKACQTTGQLWELFKQPNA